MAIDPVISDHRLWIGFAQPEGLETGVSIGLLVSSERIRLVYAPKGESSGHVTFPIHQMTMAANWPILAALHLLLHSDRLFIGLENQRLPAILETSRRYQNEVSIRLAGQVLRALNELVRGFHEADRVARGNTLQKHYEYCGLFV